MSTPKPLPTTQERQLQPLTIDVNVKPIILEHLVSLFDSYPTLYPRSFSFTRTDGLHGNYLSLIGTIPMVHLGVTYHAPIVIKVMETYPHDAPLVFVNPDRCMVINKNNPFVCPCGLVSTDYLTHWVSTSSNLLDLCRDLSTCFGNNPPLYSKHKRNPNPKPYMNPNPNTNTNFNGLDQNPEGNPNPKPDTKCNRNLNPDNDTNVTGSGLIQPAIRKRRGSFVLKLWCFCGYEIEKSC